MFFFFFEISIFPKASKILSDLNLWLWFVCLEGPAVVVIGAGWGAPSLPRGSFGHPGVPASDSSRVRGRPAGLLRAFPASPPACAGQVAARWPRVGAAPPRGAAAWGPGGRYPAPGLSTSSSSSSAVGFRRPFRVARTRGASASPAGQWQPFGRPLRPASEGGARCFTRGPGVLGEHAWRAGAARRRRRGPLLLLHAAAARAVGPVSREPGGNRGGAGGPGSAACAPGRRPTRPLCSEDDAPGIGPAGPGPAAHRGDTRAASRGRRLGCVSHGAWVLCGRWGPRSARAAGCCQRLGPEPPALRLRGRTCGRGGGGLDGGAPPRSAGTRC